jgi:ribosomal protein S3AE
VKKKGRKKMGLIENFEKKRFELAKKYIKQGKISKGLRYILEDLVKLKEKGLKEKDILELINGELKVTIKQSAFHSFFYRYVKGKKIEVKEEPKEEVKEIKKETKQTKQIDIDLDEITKIYKGE